MNPLGPAVAALVGAFLLAGCAGPSERTDDVITVFAAASLQRPLTELGEVYEQAHPGVSVQFAFAGSAELVSQLADGAAADVLATADGATMGRAHELGLLRGAAVPLAGNSLAIVAPPSNPAGIGGVADLQASGLALVLCSPQVPCGAAAAQVQRNLDVRWRPVSEESSVAGVLGKVVAGEADAGVVYATDAAAAQAAGTAVGIAIPAAMNTTTTAMGAVVGAAPDAESFLSLVTGSVGRGRFAAAGFRLP